MQAWIITKSLPQLSQLTLVLTEKQMSNRIQKGERVSKKRWGGRTNESVSLCISESFQHNVKWQTWTLIAFCCVHWKVHLQMLDGLAETSSASSINTFPWHGELWFYNESLSMFNTQESGGMRHDFSSHVYCKSAAVYFWKEVLEQWGGVQFKGSGPT